MQTRNGNEADLVFPETRPDSRPDLKVDPTPPDDPGGVIDVFDIQMPSARHIR
jgi:hypothetical protein